MPTSFINPLGSNYAPNESNTSNLLGAARAGHAHGGNDLFTLGKECGAPVYAAADGTVTGGSGTVGSANTGLKVGIDHGNGTFTNYFHLQHSCVKPGQQVKQGQQIGTVGNSGTSTCHLHYEINQGAQFQAQGGRPLVDPNHPRQLAGVNNTQFDPTCGALPGSCNSQASSKTTSNYRPGSKSNLMDEIAPLPEAETQSDTPQEQTCEKKDTPTTVAIAQDRGSLQQQAIKDEVKRLQQLPDSGEQLRQLAGRLASNGSSTSSVNSFVPPPSNFLSNRLGSSGVVNSDASKLTSLQQSAASINNLMHFTQMDTATLRHFVQLFRSIPNIPELQSLPYFKPLSLSIGQSLVFLTDASALANKDWMSNAATGMGQLSPVSILNRSLVPKVVNENVDKLFKDLNTSIASNLNQLHSQYSSFLGQFGSLLGFLPKELTQFLSPVLSAISKGEGLVDQIMGMFGKLSNTAHGLDMIVDIAHLERLHGAQNQMLSKLTSQFGDQLRMVNNIYPIRGAVQIENSIIESNIHGYPAVVNLIGSKILKTKYTDEVLKAIKPIL